MIHVYVHYPSIKEARKISRLILQKHLAACVNFIKQEDLYWWRGKMVQTRGIVTLIATQKKYFRTIKALVKSQHSYEVPCILEMPVGRVLRSYERWLIDETRNPKSA
ncbi:MAG: divalent-cation tolerance protein CutA [Patescibacteria group bacterium]|jgi:periplasmic divalent cation tolerance protein